MAPTVARLIDIADKGFCVIPGVFDDTAIAQMRCIILSNLDIMSNTRPTETARHLAGFHRFPCFEPMHAAISTDSRVGPILDSVYCRGQMISLGLSDITINRSQLWHTDLLRGDYAKHLTRETCWETSEPPCLKALIYLQDGASLHVLAGSHRRPIALSDDRNAVPASDAEIESVAAKAGDVILMDIRTIHRGSTEAEMGTKGLGVDAKILISTVFGDRYSKLAQAMQKGNAERTVDWDMRHRPPTSSVAAA
jgi:hypothetical protein